MEIPKLNKSSDVPISTQIYLHTVMLIATGKLKPGDKLDSERQLARRLNIATGTISVAFKELVKRGYVERHHGARMTVRPLDAAPAMTDDLDELIDSAIRTAHERGYTLQALRERVRERLLEEAPDHILLLEPEAGMQRLLYREISDLLSAHIESMSLDELQFNPGAMIGALIVCLPGRAQKVLSLLPKHHPFLVLQPSGIEDQVELIRELKRPSVIGVVSISQVFLETARGLLAPFVGTLHELEEYHVGNADIRNLSALDLVFCDSVVRDRIKAPQTSHYRLVSHAAAVELSGRLGLRAS